MKSRNRTKTLAIALLFACHMPFVLNCDEAPESSGRSHFVEDDDPHEISDEELASFKTLRGIDCESTRNQFPGSGTEIRKPYTGGRVSEETRKGEPWHSDELHQAVDELNGSFHGCLRKFGLKIEKGDCFIFEATKGESSYNVDIEPDLPLKGCFDNTTRYTSLTRCLAGVIGKTPLEECMDGKIGSGQTPNLNRKQPLNVCIDYYNDYPMAGH